MKAEHEDMCYRNYRRRSRRRRISSELLLIAMAEYRVIEFATPFLEMQVRENITLWNFGIW